MTTKKSPVNKYQHTIVACDIVIFTIKNEKLQTLLIKMKKEPYHGHWAIPGGLVNIKESLDDAAKRHLSDKTGVKGIYLEQLYTFGAVDRDPFGRVVSVAYFALFPANGLKVQTSTEYSDISWFNVESLPELAYDHRQILDTAVQRLKTKLEYTNIVYNLMPAEFTLSQLQKTYEMILKRKMDKRNFRKKILSLELIKPSGKATSGQPNRPSQLYRFSRKAPQFIQIV